MTREIEIGPFLARLGCWNSRNTRLVASGVSGVDEDCSRSRSRSRGGSFAGLIARLASLGLVIAPTGIENLVLAEPSEFLGAVGAFELHVGRRRQRILGFRWVVGSIGSGWCGLVVGLRLVLLVRWSRVKQGSLCWRIESLENEARLLGLSCKTRQTAQNGFPSVGR